MIPLFEQYPALQQKLAYVSLGDLPTPVHRLERLERYLGAGHIYIKRDDLSGVTYGGTKLRKLEFLLSAALHTGAKTILTFGYAGSNHTLATTIYACRLGMQSISELLPQPNAQYVRDNLLAGYRCGADLHHYPNLFRLVLGTMRDILRYKYLNGRFPTLLPAGGSSSLGAIGLVNAALELRNQVERGLLQEPDRIFVALGSMGTAVGLTIGLKAAQLKSRVIAVRVVDRTLVNEKTMLQRLKRLNHYLHAQDPSFPMFKLTGADFEIRPEFYGGHYALFTKQGLRAVALMKKYEGIVLDGTYTGKTMAALLADVEQQNQLQNGVILFWNSYNSRDLSAVIAGLDYRHLPRALHWYFEHDVQPVGGPGIREG